MEWNINQPQNPRSKDPTLKIVMIGKAGGGRSATGNTILGRNAFRSQIFSDSQVTQECQVETGAVDGQNLTVIDTPGLFGSIKSPSAGFFYVDKQKKKIEQIEECMMLASPGSVVFLVVLQLGRFTKEERQTVRVIQKTFGRDAAHYTMALFTRGEDLKTEGVSIDELIGAHRALRDFIRECRGGYHVFDNRDKDPSQVTELLQKINSMVQRNGERSFENDQEDEGDLLNNSFMKTCLDGAFDGAWIMCIILLFIWLTEGCPSLQHVEVVAGAGCALGAVAGAVRYVVWRLIRGGYHYKLLYYIRDGV